MPGPALASFLTFVTYGSRLHGDERGTVDRHHTERGTPHLPRDDFRRRYQRGLMHQEPFVITAEIRACIEQAFAEVAEHRQWTILALNIRLEHVHIVIAADIRPDLVSNTLKAYGTRALRSAGLITQDRKVWARHGSTGHQWEESDVAAAVDYTANQQGADLPGAGPLHRLGKVEPGGEDGQSD